MNTKKPSRRNKQAFDFILIVRECIKMIIDPEATEATMNAATNKFLTKLDEAQRLLMSTDGLDMTEEEQIQKITALEEAIKQKKRLIEECQRCYESWQTE